MEKSKKRLGEILVEDGLLAREHLDEALQYQKKQGGMIGQILIRMGYVTEEELIVALAKQLRLPYVPLTNYAVNPEAVQLLEEKFCRNHGLIAFDMDETKLYLALSDPLDDIAIQDIFKKTDKKLQVFISTPTEIQNMIEMTLGAAMQQKLKKAS